MSDQVGFAFQADVVNMASLSHMLTGRVLKALSDGGVDTYAMFAAFWLGGKIPVRTSLSETIHSQIVQKSSISIQSVLAKALSIGWGHSTPVIEMTRTQAGTNALLVIGALATGSTPFQAAQLLHELLSIYGLDPQNLPNIDVLRGLTSYLAPFVHDMGFSKVLHHITVTTERAIRTSNKFANQSAGDQEHELWKMRCLGNASIVAGDIKQVIFTARRRESHYMILKARGAWLPAFSCHILGMSVEVRLDEEILWACGGDRGTIIFQMGNYPMKNLSLQSIQTPLDIISTDDIGKSLQERSFIEYPLDQAVSSNLAKWPEVDQDLTDIVHGAINSLSDEYASLYHIATLTRDKAEQKNKSFPTQGDFDIAGAIRETLAAMNIHSGSTGEGPPYSYNTDWRLRCSRWQLGLSTLSANDLKMVMRRCVLHTCMQSKWRLLMYDCDTKATPDCLCKRLGMLVSGVAAAAVALARCKFDSSQIMLQESMLMGETPAPWSQKLFCPNGDEERYPRNDEFFDYLGRLLCHDYTDTWLASYNTATRDGPQTSVLGLSGGTFTIYYTSIMSRDCYDELGRMIEIRNGRASVAGMFRSVLVEWGTDNGHYYDQMHALRDNMEPSILAGGSHLGPHFRPSQTQFFMDASVDEALFSLRLRLHTPTSQTLYFPLTIFLVEFLSTWRIPRCEHARSDTYECQHDGEVAVDGFNGAYRWVNLNKPPSEVLVFALKGDKLQQIFMCTFLSWARGGFEHRPGVLQLYACLKCSINEAKLGNKLPVVIIGG
ncbi:hypothetical protein CGCSCA4_v009864 [Colletotrichum siamense]|uniref:Uncharacterized protein n=1 Tax=Colletotrichum siamense TaxID=690259 RepID=A0A9P5EQB5_COLSI|nr:hypothetical protein CGCSCA4_v009864 [Colletotrichum siamense]KAF4857542.1 hypothetical protein CGCSCA2_v008135 [Colletotrichum siamense]